MYLIITILAVAVVAAVAVKMRLSLPPVACPWCQALQTHSAPRCGVCGGALR